MHLTVYLVASLTLLYLNSANELGNLLSSYDPEEDNSNADNWGYVVQLTAENIEEKLNSVDRTLIFFYTSSCRFYHERKPEFKAAAVRVNKRRRDVQLASMDCIKYSDKCLEMRVGGYPSFYLYEKTKFLDIHHGEPVRENFIRTILAHLAQKEESKPSSTERIKREL